MRYRIYFKHPDQEEVGEVREIEADGTILRICDDHDRVVFGAPYPENPPFTPSISGREPLAYN